MNVASEPSAPAAADAEAVRLYRPRLRMTQPVARPPLDRAALDWRGGVLVRSSNWLGDALMSLPALYQVSRLLPPGARLGVISPQGLAPLWQAVPWVEHAIPFAGRRLGGAALAAARSAGAGIGLVLPNSFGSALDLWRVGPPVRVGRRDRWRGALLTHTLPALRHTMHVGQYHQLTEALELASLLGEVAWTTACPPLAAASAETCRARFGLPRDDGCGWLALGPGAAFGPAKQWPATAFRAVAARWCAGGGLVLALGTAAERSVAESVTAGLTGAWNLAGRTTLSELMSLLRGCRAVVANDSGLMHLAAALGVPGVALYGCTDPAGTGPVGPGAWVVLANHRPCAPCFRQRCRYTRRGCLGLQDIPPERVSAALDFVLAAGGAPPAGPA
jgi:heptosyltransferase-2